MRSEWFVPAIWLMTVEMPWFTIPVCIIIMPTSVIHEFITTFDRGRGKNSRKVSIEIRNENQREEGTEENSFTETEKKNKNTGKKKS